VLDVINISDHEFESIRRLVYDRFGIALSDQKRALVVGRLNKLLRKNNLKSFQDYYDYVVNDQSGKALSDFVDKISTNHTYFFRENDHFDYLLNVVLPEIINANLILNRKILRVWCAASSSGEEPYTLAMFILEYLRHDIVDWDVGVLATDISQSILDVAKKGVYQGNNVHRMPVGLKNKYLEHIGEDAWQVRRPVKDLVLFRRLNLIQRDFPFKGKFHIIFARNVMIYFDEATRKSLVERFFRYTNNGGYLFIGHSETLGRSHQLFKFVKPAIYRKEPGN